MTRIELSAACWIQSRETGTFFVFLKNVTIGVFSGNPFFEYYFSGKKTSFLLFILFDIIITICFRTIHRNKTIIIQK